jgi:hypothetical protein
MKDALVTLFSRLTSSDAVTVVEVVCFTGICLFGVVCIGGYDLSIGTTGLSCTKHDRVSENQSVACVSET